MTSCLQAIRRVIIVEENTAEEELTAPLGDVFVEPVARRITLHPSVKQEKRTHNVEVEEDESSEEEFLYCVTTLPEMTETVNSVSECEISAKMLINEKPIKFHIDCGATVNVLPSKYVNKEDTKQTKRVLQMCNKTELKPEGICCVTICNPKKRKKYSVEFTVVKENLNPLLGAKAIQHIELIEVHKENFEKVAAVKIASTKAQAAEEIIDEYSNVFEGDLGTLEGIQHLDVDPSVPPSIAPSRRVPFAIKRSSKLSMRD